MTSSAGADASTVCAGQYARIEWPSDDGTHYVGQCPECDAVIRIDVDGQLAAHYVLAGAP